MASRSPRSEPSPSSALDKLGPGAGEPQSFIHAFNKRPLSSSSKQAAFWGYTVNKLEKFFIWWILHECILSRFSRVGLSVTLRTVAHQAPLSMGFSRQEYWNGLSCPPLGIFPTQGSNPCLLCLLQCRRILYPLSHLGSPWWILHSNKEDGL